MKFWGTMFGTPKALGDIVSKSISVLDKCFYTEEEKAGVGAKDRSEMRGVVLTWLASSKGQNIARRFIAVLVTILWAKNYITVWALTLANAFADKDSIDKAIVDLQTSGEQITGAMMLVLAFYFAAPYVGDVMKVAMQKFSKPKEVA